MTPPTRLPAAADDQRRGQTVQDFAIGASIFLLTVAFVFAFVPSIFAPFDSDVTPGAAQQADRVASKIVSEYQVEDRPNWLRDSVDDTDELLTLTENELRDKFGLPITAQINVQLVQIDPGSGNDGSLVQEAGRSFNNRPAASVSRVVVVEGENQCYPGDGDGQSVCRLVVRVW